MHNAALIGVAFALLAGLAMGCASPESPGAPSREEARPRVVKRVVAAIQGDPHVLVARIDPAGINAPGIDVLEELLNTGLTTADNEARRHARLAEQVPTVENGLWRVFPDGRMETSWRIRDTARWHDGTAITADDFVFTAQVDQDKDLVAARNLAYEVVDTVEAPDSRTVLIRWKRPYIEADTMFSPSAGPPLPKHLLEQPYREDKANFLQLPFWTSGYVGSGPYKVRELVRGSSIRLDAFDGYALGRPRIDEIEVKFIIDTNTLMANILAGAVELTVGRSLTLEQAIQVRDQWRDGRAEIAFQSWIMMYPQFLNPSPPVVGDVRFRRALLHAIDRQEMAETLNFGLVPVAHAFLSPTEAEYKEIEGSIVRYDYDPRRAAQLIQGLGYAKGPDGMFRDGAGQRVAVEIRVSARNPISNKSLLAVADYWQQVGVSAEPLVIPTQRSDDREYVANFPAFHLYRQPNDVNSVKRYHGSQSRTAERSYVGTNYNRYRNPEYDGLIDQYFTTIPREQRAEVLGRIVHHMTDQVLLMGLFYDTESTMVSGRLRHVTGRAQGATQAWNAHEWEAQ